MRGRSRDVEPVERRAGLDQAEEVERAVEDAGLALRRDHRRAAPADVRAADDVAVRCRARELLRPARAADGGEDAGVPTTSAPSGARPSAGRGPPRRAGPRSPRASSSRAATACDRSLDGDLGRRRRRGRRPASSAIRGWRSQRSYPVSALAP